MAVRVRVRAGVSIEDAATLQTELMRKAAAENKPDAVSQSVELAKAIGQDLNEVRTAADHPSSSSSSSVPQLANTQRGSASILTHWVIGAWQFVASFAREVTVPVTVESPQAQFGYPPQMQMVQQTVLQIPPQALDLWLQKFIHKLRAHPERWARK